MASDRPIKHGSDDPRFPINPVTWQKVATRLQLAPMQAFVAEWVLIDLQNKQIGEQLGIGEATVKSHLQEVYAKARQRTRVKLVVRLFQLANEIERKSPPDG